MAQLALDVVLLGVDLRLDLAQNWRAFLDRVFLVQKSLEVVDFGQQRMFRDGLRQWNRGGFRVGSIANEWGLDAFVTDWNGDVPLHMHGIRDSAFDMNWIRHRHSLHHSADKRNVLDDFHGLLNGAHHWNFLDDLHLTNDGHLLNHLDWLDHLDGPLNDPRFGGKNWGSNQGCLLVEKGVRRDRSQNGYENDLK